MKQVALEGFLKNTEIYAGPSQHLRLSFCGISYQLSAANFTKNPNIDAMGLLNAPLQYYNVF